MRCRFSNFPPEAARDPDQDNEHSSAGNNEITQDSSIAVYAAKEDRTDTHVAVDGGIGNECKLPARNAPGERPGTGRKQSEKPYAGIPPIEDAGEQCPKKNIGRDVQIRSEEMRLKAAVLEKRSGGAHDQAVEKRVLAIRRVLM
jgi:hypothetical protein